MQLAVFPILVLSACVVTAQVLNGDSAQSVITELVEDQKYFDQIANRREKMGN
jgi:hypothetical protein